MKKTLTILSLLTASLTVSMNAMADAQSCRAIFPSERISTRPFVDSERYWLHPQTNIAISIDGRFEVNSSGIRNTQTGEVIAFDSSIGQVRRAQFSKDGARVLVSAVDMGPHAGLTTTNIYDLVSKKIIQTFSSVSTGEAQAVSEDVKLIARNVNGMTIVTETETGREVFKMISGADTMSQVTLSPDKSKLVISGSREQVIDLRTGKVLYSFNKTNLSFSPDSRFIVSADFQNPALPFLGKRLSILDANTGEVIYETRLPRTSRIDVINAKFSPDFDRDRGTIEMTYTADGHFNAVKLVVDMGQSK